jgi:hypothetical protein
VGFVFDRHVVAQYVKEEDEHWLMLNPFDNGDPQSGKLKKLDEVNMADVYASALHEVTHMADRTSDHDVDFAKALTKNIGKMFGKEKQARAIKSLVLSAEKEVATRLKTTKPRREAPAFPKAPKERRRDFVDVRAGTMLGGGQRDGEIAKDWVRPSSKWMVIRTALPGSDSFDPRYGFELVYAFGPAGPETVEVIRLPMERGGLIEQLGLSNEDVLWIADSNSVSVWTFEEDATASSASGRLAALNWILAAMELSAEDVAQRAGEPIYRMPMVEWERRWGFRF